MKYSIAPAMEVAAQMPDPYVAFDLDGTLASYTEFKGWQHIGDPVPAAVEFVKKLRAKGITCKILTARVSEESRAIDGLTFPQVEQVIQDWTEKHIGERLPVIASKGCGMICCFDDSIVQVEKNTFRFLGGKDALLPFAEKLRAAVKTPTQDEEK